MQTGVVYPQQTNTCLPIFNCLQAEEGDEATSPPFEATNAGIDASSSSLEVLGAT